MTNNNNNSSVSPINESKDPIEKKFNEFENDEKAFINKLINKNVDRKTAIQTFLTCGKDQDYTLEILDVCL